MIGSRKIGFSNQICTYAWNDLKTLSNYVYISFRHKTGTRSIIWLNVINLAVQMKVKIYVKITQIWHGEHISNFLQKKMSKVLQSDFELILIKIFQALWWYQAY